MGLERRREAAARDAPGEGSACSPWVWRGSKHVSSRSSCLISQHNADGDGHQTAKPRCSPHLDSILR